MHVNKLDIDTSHTKLHNIGKLRKTKVATFEVDPIEFKPSSNSCLSYLTTIDRSYKTL